MCSYISSGRERLNFYAEIQIIFGTVYKYMWYLSRSNAWILKEITNRTCLNELDDG